MRKGSRRAAAFTAVLTAMLALGAAAPPASAHEATTICAPNLAEPTPPWKPIPWACVYSDGGYWCHKVYGGENWTSYCVGATGVRICTYMYPGPEECEYTP